MEQEVRLPGCAGLVCVELTRPATVGLTVYRGCTNIMFVPCPYELITCIRTVLSTVLWFLVQLVSIPKKKRETLCQALTCFFSSLLYITDSIYSRWSCFIFKLNIKKGQHELKTAHAWEVVVWCLVIKNWNTEVLQLVCGRSDGAFLRVVFIFSPYIRSTIGQDLHVEVSSCAMTWNNASLLLTLMPVVQCPSFK